MVAPAICTFLLRRPHTYLCVAFRCFRGVAEPEPSPAFPGVCSNAAPFRSGEGPYGRPIALDSMRPRVCSVSVGTACFRVAATHVRRSRCFDRDRACVWLVVNENVRALVNHVIGKWQVLCYKNVEIFDFFSLQHQHLCYHAAAAVSSQRHVIYIYWIFVIICISV